jgi:hypothetical protein
VLRLAPAFHHHLATRLTRGFRHSPVCQFDPCNHYHRAIRLAREVHHYLARRLPTRSFRYSPLPQLAQAFHHHLVLRLTLPARQTIVAFGRSLGVISTLAPRGSIGIFITILTDVSIIARITISFLVSILATITIVLPVSIISCITIRALRLDRSIRYSYCARLTPIEQNSPAIQFAPCEHHHQPPTARSGHT